MSQYAPTARLIDALPTLPVLTGGSVTFVKVALGDVNDSPPGNAAAKVPELEKKPESAIFTKEETIPIPTWATWIKVSNQCLSDVVGLRAILEDLLRGGF